MQRAAKSRKGILKLAINIGYLASFVRPALKFRSISGATGMGIKYITRRVERFADKSQEGKAAHYALAMARIVSLFSEAYKGNFATDLREALAD